MLGAHPRSDTPHGVEAHGLDRAVRDCFRHAFRSLHNAETSPDAVEPGGVAGPGSTMTQGEDRTEGADARWARPRRVAGALLTCRDDDALDPGFHRAVRPARAHAR